MKRFAIPAALLAAAVLGQTPPNPSATSPDPDMPRPIAARDSVFIEELTWLEVRDAMRAGKKTVLVATGGIEQNGPYLATGKHNYILRVTTEAIARRLGDALVAPIVPFVPEGEIDPPTGHMRYPGTISVGEETFRRLLTDIASSLRTHGFEHIVLVGDSGGNQAGMKAVAEELGPRWKGGKSAIYFIPEYYDYPGVDRWVREQGMHERDEGFHDNVGITALMMAADPATVRMKERIAARKFSINGIPLAPAEKTIALGKQIAEYRAGITAAAIRRARGR
jgi:creatinine amidohydrolase/Fe(II)-dependent formamide hydrolase-like protein